MLRHAEVAQQAARNAGDRADHAAAHRLSAPPRCPPACHAHCAISPAGTLGRRRSHDRARAGTDRGARARRLDAVVTSLPAPTQGLRVTSLARRAP